MYFNVFHIYFYFLINRNESLVIYVFVNPFLTMVVG